MTTTLKFHPGLSPDLRAPSLPIMNPPLVSPCALSQYSLTAEKGDAPQLVPLNRFLSALAPYFVDVPSAQIRALDPGLTIEDIRR
jgi:hypothetical protein